MKLMAGQSTEKNVRENQGIIDFREKDRKRVKKADKQ